MATETNQALIVPRDLIWRLSVDNYHEMIHVGILTDDDPVELIEGWLVTKMPKNPAHTLATENTRDGLAEIIPSGWFVRMQEPITTEDSEPEPVVMVVRGKRQDYPDQHPGPADVALVVEVADATLSRDRSLKLRMYARARIAVYWILNLPDQQLEVYTVPEGAGDEATYRIQTIYRIDDHALISIEGREVGQLTIRALLP